MEATALQAVQSIPADVLPVVVARWDVSFGADWTDDEAFFVQAFLDTDDVPRGAMTTIQRAVREAVDQSGARPGAWTYLSLRTTEDVT